MSSPRNHSKVYLDCYAPNPLVDRNRYKSLKPDRTSPPTFHDSRELLPAPFWEGNETAIEAYWAAWDLAFRNLRRPIRGSGLVRPFIDTAFNDCIFLWDSVFILYFGRYGTRAFDFQGTLDNLYAMQHPDGFITRELQEWDGQDRFHRHDPSSTGPNLFAWSEWEYYLNFGDEVRLRDVYPVLLAYHQWCRRYRTWPDGSYWSTGWGCGMDNQPRTPKGFSREYEHGFMSWADATLQAVLSARLLLKMAKLLGEREGVEELETEHAHLTRWVNREMWSDPLGFYVDRLRDGSLSEVKSIGAFWALLAEVAPPERRNALIAHLENPETFNRPHRVPSLSADHPDYDPRGNYWSGGVWPSTNYMVLRGLTQCGAHDLAAEIGRNHHACIVKVFEETRTFWESYAPESWEPGHSARDAFVGWGGIGPIAVLLEYVFGIRPDVSQNKLIWDIRMTDAFGVSRYPVGAKGLVDLKVQRRRSLDEEPQVEVTGNLPLKIEVNWRGGTKEISQS